MDWVLLGQQVWFGVVNGATYVVAASGLTIVFGVLGIFNMAHGEFAMLGAMTTVALTTAFNLHFLAAAICAATIVAVLGLGFNRMVLRRVVPLGPFSVVLATMAISFVFTNGAVAVWGSYPRALVTPFEGVFSVGGIRVSGQSLVLITMALVTTTALHLLLTKSRLGRGLRATSQNDLGARLVGISLRQVYDFSLLTATGLAALAGVLVATIEAAQPLMGQELLVKGFVVCIVGGMGSVSGVITSGMLLGVLEALFGQYISPLNRTNFIYGIMIITLLLRPQGLFGKSVRVGIR